MYGYKVDHTLVYSDFAMNSMVRYIEPSTQRAMLRMRLACVGRSSASASIGP
jgi:hypothetical protein